MHEAGVGVILDWCPAYFPNDRYGLFEFDGKPLYEYEAKDVADSSEGCIFNVKRGEVKSFLLSSAFYWLREFHIDALKVSYALDKNKYTDSTLYAGDVEFLKVLNFNIKREFTDVFTLADGATKWRGVTSPEGLGFDLACSANWSEEVLGYGGIDPIFRKYHHSQINSILQKSFEERYVLTITHDDVTRGKKSFLDKMHGDYWQKFANARAILGYMMTSPGKKTFFMGGEIGHFREWDHEGEMEWFLLEYDAHAKFQRYVAELNHLYLSSHELWENDGAYGFCFVDADNAEQSIISYRRFSNEGKELQIIINFTPVVYENYSVGVPSDGEYEEMINSDDIRFGGGGVVNKSPLQAKKEMAHGLPYSLNLNIPPLGMIVLRKK
jgi:1,4-alpha-glucan branching enzyme